MSYVDDTRGTASGCFGASIRRAAIAAFLDSTLPSTSRGLAMGARPIPSFGLHVLAFPGGDVNFDDVLDSMFRVCAIHGCRPDVPLESEDYFRQLVASYQGSPEAFEAWLDSRLAESFRSLTHPPDWLQGPEWPLRDGRPMTFVGQIEVRRSPSLPQNHDAIFYVFWDKTSGGTRVIIQTD